MKKLELIKLKNYASEVRMETKVKTIDALERREKLIKLAKIDYRIDGLINDTSLADKGYIEEAIENLTGQIDQYRIDNNLTI